MAIKILFLILFIFVFGAPQAQGKGITLTLKKLPFRPNTTTQMSALASTSSHPLSARKSFFGVFYVELLVGTPPVKLNLVVDTASSPMWVQSAHCTDCFPVSSVQFDPNRSMTFQFMPFDHPICVPIWLHPSGNFCSYESEYAANQFTIGTFGLDTLTTVTTSSTADQPTQIQGVAFGCGVINRIDLPGDAVHPNEISGILGLGIDHPSSFLLQLSSMTLKRFSYCIPYRVGAVSSLRFGEDAQLTGSDIQTTPLLESSSDFYYINMTGISLNGSRLPTDPRMFKAWGNSGVVVDTGTEYSLFASEVYTLIHQAMKSYFTENYSMKPLNKTRSGLELCYNMVDVLRTKKRRGLKFFAPEVIFHLDRADLKLNEATTFRADEDLQEFCMMIRSAEIFGASSILGAFQQYNNRFLIDVPESKFSFTAEMC
ncbi:aspartic proteinase nepenthesin-1-like [Pyrus ussuriensis x Pyrus communis]|uniref:Aspartic proteinase nepenthesin-1-like n=1 Tax=Pyrus ussuriensis x Pyrus communis TaxID=2448454 RepID=A0A5N5HU80_9ROSA|nr:aspartic proteinase nepenthesin-1-like [Pyrus ussuriensis x Pyrus communis]